MVTSEERKSLAERRYADGIGVVLSCAAGLALLIATAYVGQVNEEIRYVAKPAISGELVRADIPPAPVAPDTDSTQHPTDRASD
jgi:hypothetical protein